MTRILFIHQSSAIGGGSYCLLNIIKVINRERFEPIVALKSEGPLAGELRKLGVEVVLFPQITQIPYNESLFRVTSIKAYLSVILSLKRFGELLKRERIDVVYLNNMMIAPYLVPSKKAGCKTVVHVREHWPLGEHKRQLGWIRKIVYGNCDKLIAINHYSASIFPEKEAAIVYDWIDMSSRYKPMPTSEIFCEDMKGKKVLLFTGGSQFIKGSDYVIDAFSRVVSGDDYRLLIVGINDLPQLSGFKHKVKSLLEHFGYYYYDKRLRELLSADKRIKCIPAVYELNHLIEQSCCFVSYFRIPHANLTLAENIILGNPCIAADTEEAREYSGDGQYAMLINPMNNPDVFANGLKSFLRDIVIWQNASKKGSDVIAKQFDPTINIMRLNKVLWDFYKIDN